MPPESALPPLVINPQALSTEHHFLRVLSAAEPRTRAEAVAKVIERFPGYTALGTPEQPTSKAQHAWEALIANRWCRYVNYGSKHGQVLTGIGDERIAIFYRQQIWLPYLKVVEATCGAAAARAVAATYR